MIKIHRQLLLTLFKKFPGQSNHYPNKIWVNKGSDIYKRYMKIWLKDKDTQTYSTNNEWKYVAAERFIITLKNKIYKYMTSFS